MAVDCFANSKKQLNNFSVATLWTITVQCYVVTTESHRVDSELIRSTVVAQMMLRSLAHTAPKGIMTSSMRRTFVASCPQYLAKDSALTAATFQKIMDSDAMATKGSMKNNIHQVITGRKRFYKNVGIKTVVEGKEEKYVVTLDGRNLRTPARNPLQLPTKELALCIAAEWDAQTDQRKGLQPVTMPLMSLASTAIDQIAVDRDITIANCVKYLPTDSALFFTSPEDRILLKKQKLYLQPVIKALNKKLQIDLQTTQAMNGRNQQSENTVVTIHRVVEAMDDFTLACLQSATIECKSIVLGLAFVGRLISLEESIAASRLEEEFQLEIWGVVEGGHDMDRLNNAVALSAAHTFMTLYADSAQAKNILQVKQ